MRQITPSLFGAPGDSIDQLLTYHSWPVLLICLVFFYPLLGVVEFLLFFYNLESCMLEL